jgi:HNH endonuclease
MQVARGDGLDGATFWQFRRCLRAPIPEIAEAQRLLDDAANAHLIGDRERAGIRIAAADMPSIRDWTESIWGRHDKSILRERPDPNAPVIIVGRANRPKPRCPNSETRRQLLARDGYRCRFCGIAVIDKRIRMLLRAAYPAALPWGPRNCDQHAAFQCMWLQYDHVIPNGRGGESTFENMVVTCAPCNFGRIERTLAEVGVLPPAPPTPSDWDGLERLAATF